MKRKLLKVNVPHELLITFRQEKKIRNAFSS